MMYTKEYVRDDSSNALINSNKEALETYKRAKKQMQKTAMLEDEINSIKMDLELIKKTLQNIEHRIG